MNPSEGQQLMHSVLIVFDSPLSSIPLSKTILEDGFPSGVVVERVIAFGSFIDF